MKLSRYYLSTDLLEDVGLDQKRIIFSTRTGTSILVDENIYSDLIKGEFESIPFEFVQKLIEKEFLVFNDQDEIQFILESNKNAKLDASFLSMTIQPSANCQLGCHYCGQTHSKHQATDSLIEKYYERILQLLSKKKYMGLSICWYGGEPLTGFSQIKKASAKLIELANERGLFYQANIITNGLSLKPAVFEELVNLCKITAYQITIDGTAESHDKRRVTKTGDPTFDIIMKNIKDVTSTELYSTSNSNITIRVNIDKTNHQYVEPLIDYVKENGLESKVSMYFAPIVDFGGNDAGKESLEKAFFAEKEIEWLLKCIEYGIPVHNLPGRTYTVCMADNKDSEVLDAFGNIYACWEFPYSETYGSGDSLIGNLFLPEETYNYNATLRDWSETLASGKTWCKNCNQLPICGGGCPKSWHEGTPACPSFKSNYKDRLLLDYYVKKKNEESNITEPSRKILYER
jgi:uncharacterized protein